MWAFVRLHRNSEPTFLLNLFCTCEILEVLYDRCRVNTVGSLRWSPYAENGALDMHAVYDLHVQIQV